MLPADFSLSHYQFRLTLLDTLHIHPYKGSALRGGFGHTFKRLVCVQPQACHKTCQMGNSCPYGYIFETAPPDDSQVLRNVGAVPRPFVIEPPSDKRMLLIPGEVLPFGLTLIGRGDSYLPYFIAVFRELGNEGLGRKRARFQLESVDAISPYEPASKAVFRADDALIKTVNVTVDRQAIIHRVKRLPAGRLTLNFLTPTKLKHNKMWIRTGPQFQALVKSLLGRLSSLSYFHCGERLDVDFRDLIDQAATVKIETSDTTWESWSRFSGRQKQRIDMGGLMGRVTYAGELAPYLPLLAVGELIHVGKGTVFGNGQYRIEGDNTNEQAITP